MTYIEGTNEFAIKSCVASSQYPYCNYNQIEANQWNNVTCGTNPSPDLLYPGEPCTSNTQCISQSCLGGKCKGVPVGGFCSDSSDCVVGAYCYAVNLKFICVPLIPIGSGPCGTEYDCVPQAGCNATRENFPGECVAYFSVQNNDVVPCPLSGFNNLCKSGACYNNGVDDRGYCVDAPKTLPTFPSSCQTSNDCIGFNSAKQMFVGSCECGFNNEGTKYCAPFTGDRPGLTYLEQIIPIMTSKAMSVCQTTRRYYSDCLDVVAQNLGLNANNYYSSLMNFTNYVRYIGNDECVKKVINNDFWSRIPPNPPAPGPPPKNDTGSASVLSIGIALFTLIN